MDAVRHLGVNDIQMPCTPERVWKAKQLRARRDGDLELYERKDDGTITRLTHTPGYDGGAFYSPDCSEIVFRGFHPEGEALDDFRRLLAQGLVRPTIMELYVMNADGSNVRQITRTGKANFGPYFHPDGKRVIYSSNAGPGGGQSPARGAAPERELQLDLTEEARDLREHRRRLRALHEGGEIEDLDAVQCASHGRAR